jgi:hypothetical protein
VYGTLNYHVEIQRGGRSFAREPEQKLDVPCWPRQWGPDQAARVQSDTRRKMCGINDDPLVHFLVAHHAAFTDIVPPDFELRFDE